LHILVIMSRSYVYLLLLDRAGQIVGSVEHSEGEGGESVMAILRFLCVCNTHFLQKKTFCANRSTYKIIVLVKNFPKINLA
jgi:hypothetical protein